MFTHYLFTMGRYRSKGKITPANLIMLSGHLPNHGRFHPKHRSVEQKVEWIESVLADGLDVVFSVKQLRISPLTLTEFQGLKAQAHIPQPQEQAR